MFIAYRNLYILSFGVFAVLNTELGIVGILPEIATVTGKSISQVGYLITLFAITVTFVGPVFTLFALRLNQKIALILAQSLLFTANLLSILFPNYTVMMIARFLGGLGHPLFFTLALSYSAYTIPQDKQTRAISIIFGGVNLAFIIGFPVISFLASHFSWKAGFIFSMLAHLLAILSIIVCIPKTIPNKNGETITVRSFKDKGFILSIPILMLVFTGIFIMYSYFSPYLKNIWLINQKSLTIALVCFGVFGLMGNILTGLVPTKRTTRVLVIYLMLFILNYLILSSTSLHIPIFIIVSIWGFLQSGLMLLGQLWFTFSKTTHIEAVNSMLVSSANLGITLGSFIGGLVISQVGLFLLPWIGILILLLVIIGIFIDSRIKNSLTK